MTIQIIFVHFRYDGIRKKPPKNVPKIPPIVAIAVIFPATFPAVFKLSNFNFTITGVSIPINIDGKKNKITVASIAPNLILFVFSEIPINIPSWISGIKNIEKAVAINMIFKFLFTFSSSAINPPK